MRNEELGRPPGKCHLRDTRWKRGPEQPVKRRQRDRTAENMRAQEKHPFNGKKQLGVRGC